METYNPLERPVANESDPLQLSFGLTLMQIIDVVIIYILLHIHTTFVPKNCGLIRPIKLSLVSLENRDLTLSNETQQENIFEIGEYLYQKEIKHILEQRD